MDNPLTMEGIVTANKESCQVYFPKEFARQFHFPLQPDGEFFAQLVPDTAVILFPQTAEPDWPLTVRHPDSIASKLRDDNSEVRR